ARTSTATFGLSRAAARSCGIASRIATLSAWILPSAFIDPEVSSSQTKWSSRRAISPPGRMAGTAVAASADMGHRLADADREPGFEPDAAAGLELALLAGSGRHRPGGVGQVLEAEH